MVITKDMPVSGIVGSWEITKEVFEKYEISPSSTKALKEHVPEKNLDKVVDELNKIIGSTSAACSDGG